MITVKPFRAFRPPRDKAYLVATRSYLTYSDVELDDKLSNNPYTFLHVINPPAGREMQPGRAKYRKVRESFDERCEEGVFLQDAEESYYLYRQVKDGNEYTGLIAAVSIEDYLQNRIKKHEATLTEREEMFGDYLEEVGFHAEPVVLTYRDDGRLDAIFGEYIHQRPEYEFTSTDRVLHQLWKIDDPEYLQAITEVYKAQEALYIADGHHRCASSALLAERVENRQNPPKTDYHKFFMALLIGEEQMKVYDYNRLLVGKNDKPDEELLAELSTHFNVEPKGTEPFKPEKLHEMGMYLSGQWYKLVPQTGTFDSSDAIGHLDTEILSRNVLKPIFGIRDLRSDQRVDFLPGTHGLKGLQQAVDRGDYEVAFALHPAKIEQIKQVADEGRSMPPKSTYIEPKLRSGLTVYKFLD